MRPKPIAVIILDGWGVRDATAFNAILAAKTPHWDKLWQTCPHTTLDASGEAVGLPAGQMGNSEVGHLTIGAGRRVYQDLTRISKAIQDNQLCQNVVLQAGFEKARDQNARVHILGLLSNGGVHSHLDQITAVIDCAKTAGVKNLRIHAFLDGRDTPPKSAGEFILKLEQHCQDQPGFAIGSLCGRYYAMDRDQRFERTEKAYDLLTLMKADHHASNALEGLEQAYARLETDEFVAPTCIGQPCPIQDKDVVLFMNFRSDRARQLSYALTDPAFTGFTRTKIPKLAAFITLTNYAQDLKAEVLFPPPVLTQVIGEILQDHQLQQLRIAETEKYAHVTFFLNGGQENCFRGEERILIPSPKVATYDQKPEMSAFELTDRLVKEILSQRFHVIFCNFANADMVGHTGNFAATVQAIEALDRCLGKIITALEQVNGQALITADHGNAEIMFDQATQQPHTAHTNERVPFIYVGPPASIRPSARTLADIAPSLLYLLGLSPSPEMTGQSLIQWS